MTSTQELQAFAQILEPLCKAAKFEFICLTAEHLYLGGGLLRIRPCLFLSQVAEELACGHLVPAASGRNLFLRVRTPLAVSSTLKFITVRTFSLIIAEHRGCHFHRFHRLPPVSPPPPDLWDFVTQAAAGLLQTPAAENLFIQFDEAAPIKPGVGKSDSELILAYRLTFSTGTLFADVLPSSSSGLTPAAGGESAGPVQFYLL